MVEPIEAALRRASPAFRTAARRRRCYSATSELSTSDSSEATIANAGDEAKLLPDGRGHPFALGSWVAADRAERRRSRTDLWGEKLSPSQPVHRWMSDEFTTWERQLLDHFLILGHEVEATARALRARYVSAHIQLSATELIVFSYEDGRVWVAGTGYEVELSGRPEW